MAFKNIESNPILDRLPKHLRQFIKPQDYEDYSAIDQAVWRYAMRKNVDYLSQVAHSTYLEGLQQTGISVDAIPNMYGMNRILKAIGWAAVAVDGFIPPNAFMEFQAYNVLVIASDIRQLEHIEYTPAPDIIHEGAGHAPIIANPEYAEYLRRFGEIGCKAISSAKDYELYEAVRHLSIIKEAPNTPQDQIDLAEKAVEDLQNNMGEPSEMALIRNLHWWSVEYGLIGELNDPKIYGAGLLSSIGESAWCLTDEVKKLPYSLEAAHRSFDITKPQPQLFVTPDFAKLSLVLEQFANTMSLRKGGMKGVKKLIDSKNLGTIELSTGIQISGHFSRVIEFEGKSIYVQTTGPTALANRDKELIGHGVEYHAQGFGSPIGKLKGINISIEDMSPRDLEAYGIYEGKETTLVFVGGVKVVGEVITGTRDLQGKIQLISFKNCTVTFEDEILFDPSWGVYDMAVGVEVVSAYSGPASVNSFEEVNKVSETKTHKIKYTEKQISLYHLYRQLRTLREAAKVTEKVVEIMYAKLVANYPTDWLLMLELYEVSVKNNFSIQKILLKELDKLKCNKSYTTLIEKGIALCSN